MEPINGAMLLIATIWVGPFWLYMLLEPHSERTNEWMSGPWFLLGPLLAYLVMAILNPNGLLDLVIGEPAEIGDRLVTMLGTEEGTVLAWTHMVAGDIIVTRWMWKSALENNLSMVKIRAIVALGVMLMPVGLLLHVIWTPLGKTESLDG